MNNYMRACVRFFWVVAIGLVLAVGLGLAVVYHLPSLKPRTQPAYSTTELLLVDSASRPYVRTALSASPTTTQPTTGTAAKTTVTPGNVAPDLKALVDAANLYPLLIESDEVNSLRTRLYGYIPGAIQATAIFSSKTAARFRPSAFPVIQITATSTNRKKAIHLAVATGNAFRKWLVTAQNKTRVPVEQRIIIRPLQTPTSAVPIQKPPYSLAALVGIGIFLVFAGAAVAADRLWPRPEREVLAEVVRTGQPPVEAESAQGSSGTYA
jgi:hypothetical protein